MESHRNNQLEAGKRIAIVGSPGAGKSMLAIQLSAILELPVVHLDQLWWRPGWIEAGTDAFDAELERVVSTDTWIIDGNYSRTLDNSACAGECSDHARLPPDDLPLPVSEAGHALPRRRATRHGARLPGESRPGIPPVRLGLSKALPITRASEAERVW